MIPTPETDAVISNEVDPFLCMQSRCRKLERERDEARNQLDRICKDGFGNDNTIGLEFADDYVLRQLKNERDAARAEAAKWKANHDNQVALKSAIIQRPDLGDRSEQVQALIKNRDFLRAEIKSMRDDIKSALTLIERIKITLIDNT
jgi:hypothetical protein